MKKKLLISLSLVLGLACISGCSKKEEEVTLTLAAAASLENVFEDDIIPAFEKEHPNIHIQGVYDSSGKLQKQIEYETIFVDSRKYKFHSAAEALN